MKKRLGFTLIELLVVISIIGILASLAIPAVTGALTRGQMTGTLNNARQLHLATQQAELDQNTSGEASAWPGSNRSFQSWAQLLTNGYLSANDMRKIFSAPRVTVTTVPPTQMSDTAFNVYQVGNIEESAAVFISTKNWNAVSPALPGAAAVPYGDKGFVVMRKGGDGQVYQARFATNTNTVGVTNQPALAQ